MDQRNLQYSQWFKRYLRLHQRSLENTLEQRKSGGDWILDGEGRDSPSNPPRIKGETPNRQGFTLAAGLE
jgi:hypothetical protein